MSKKKPGITPQIVDSFQSLLHAPETRQQFGKSLLRVIEEFSTKLHPAIPRPACAANGNYDGRQMTEYLETCRQFIERELIGIAACYPSFQWLWYLRRLPRQFFEEGTERNFSLLKSGLAELISDLGSQPLGPQEVAVNFSIDPESLDPVFRLVASTRLLGLVHWLLVQAGRDVALEFEGENPFPLPRPMPDQLQAAQLYDERWQEAANPRIGQFESAAFSQQRVGTNLGRWNTTDGTASIATAVSVEPRWTSIAPFARDQRFQLGSFQGEILASYAPLVVSLKELESLNLDVRRAGYVWWTEDAVLVLALLHLAASTILFSPAILSTIQFGYALLSDKALERVYLRAGTAAMSTIQQLLPEAVIPRNYDDFIERLSALKGMPWPYRVGPAVRRVAGVWCIDFFSATGMLYDRLEAPVRPSGTLLDKPRSDHFELTVQRIIDASPWRPSDKLAELRGRNLLRLNGSPVTDADAIGQKDDTLLLVNAKSIVLPPAYGAGEFRMIRNKWQYVEEMLTAWEERVAELEGSARKGTNYDFSEFRQIVAPICIPFPVFLPWSIAERRAAPGLRAACSTSELRRWLDTAVASPVP